MEYICLKCGCMFEDEAASKGHYLPICPECGEIIEAVNLKEEG